VAVTFAVPMDESVEQLPTLSHGIAVEEVETVMDSFDIVDERTSLLRAEGGSVSQTVGRDRSTGDVSGVYQTPEVEITAEDSVAVAAVVDSPAAYDASNLSLASSSDEDDAEWVDAAEDRALTATSQSQSAPSTPHKSSSVRQITEAAPSAAPSTLVPSAAVSATTTTTAGDMYHWMKRQQDFTTSRLKTQQQQQQGQGSSGGGLRSRPPSESQVSWTVAGSGDMSRDDSVDVGRQRYVTHSAFQLADAQVQFQLLVPVSLFQFTPAVAELFLAPEDCLLFLLSFTVSFCRPV